MSFFPGLRENEVALSLVDFELKPSSVCPSSGSRRRQDQDLTKDSDTHTLTCLTDTRAIHGRTDSIVFTATARGTVYPVASQRTRGRAVDSLDEQKQQNAATFSTETTPAQAKIHCGAANWAFSLVLTLNTFESPYNTISYPNCTYSSATLAGP